MKTDMHTPPKVVTFGKAVFPATEEAFARAAFPASPGDGGIVCGVLSIMMSSGVNGATATTWAWHCGEGNTSTRVASSKSHKRARSWHGILPTCTAIQATLPLCPLGILSPGTEAPHRSRSNARATPPASHTPLTCCNVAVTACSDGGALPAAAPTAAAIPWWLLELEVRRRWWW